MTSRNKRIEFDVKKLRKKGYKVELINDNMHEFYVEFHGPINTLYHGHVWKTKVRLSADYPFSPPLIFFVDKIFHPNIADSTDIRNGEARVDLHQDWNLLDDLVYVYGIVIPQLLAEPKPSQPRNIRAAYLFSNSPATYDEIVKGYCQKYAKLADAKPEQSEQSRGKNAVTELERFAASSGEKIAA